MPHPNQSVRSPGVFPQRSRQFLRFREAAERVHAKHAQLYAPAAIGSFDTRRLDKRVRRIECGIELRQPAGCLLPEFVGRHLVNALHQPRPVAVAFGSAGAGQRVGFVDAIGLNGLRKTAGTQQGSNRQHAGANGGFVHAAIVMQGAA